MSTPDVLSAWTSARRASGRWPSPPTARSPARRPARSPAAATATGTSRTPPTGGAPSPRPSRDALREVAAAAVARRRGRRDLRHGPARRPDRHPADHRRSCTTTGARRPRSPGSTRSAAAVWRGSATGRCSRRGRCRSCCGCCASTPDCPHPAGAPERLRQPAGWSAHEPPRTSSNALKTGVDLDRRDGRSRSSTRWASPPRCCPPSSGPAPCSARSAPPPPQATGLPAGTPVIAGTTDGCAAQLGAGALRAGQLELRAGHDAGAQGRTAGAGPRPARASCTPTARPTASGCRAAPPAPAPARSARDFPGRDLDALDRRPRAAPAGTRADLSAGLARRALPVRRARRRGVHCSARPPTTVDRYAASCGASRSSSACASTTSTCSAPRVDGDLVLTGGATRSALLVPAARRRPRPPRHAARERRARPRHGPAGRAPGRDAAESPPGWSHPRGRSSPARRSDAVRRALPRFVDELERRGWLPAESAAPRTGERAPMTDLVLVATARPSGTPRTATPASATSR